MTWIIIVIVVVALALGMVAGYFVRQVVARFQKRSLETNVKELMLDAERRAADILEDARRTEREHETEFKKAKDFLLKKKAFSTAASPTSTANTTT